MSIFKYPIGTRIASKASGFPCVVKSTECADGKCKVSYQFEHDGSEHMLLQDTIDRDWVVLPEDWQEPEWCIKLKADLAGCKNAQVTPVDGPPKTQGRLIHNEKYLPGVRFRFNDSGYTAVVTKIVYNDAPYDQDNIWFKYENYLINLNHLNNLELHMPRLYMDANTTIIDICAPTYPPQVTPVDDPPKTQGRLIHNEKYLPGVRFQFRYNRYTAVVTRVEYRYEPYSEDFIWFNYETHGDMEHYRLRTVLNAGADIIGPYDPVYPPQVFIAHPTLKPAAKDILAKAAELMAERGKQYDNPEGERSMAKTVEAFNAITGLALTEPQGWLFMQVLKDVRLFSKREYHADSAEDGVAYSALKAEAFSKQGAK